MLEDLERPEEEIKEVERRFVKAEPSQGRIWKKYWEKPQNWDLSLRDVMNRVKEDIRKEIKILS